MALAMIMTVSAQCPKQVPYKMLNECDTEADGKTISLLGGGAKDPYVGAQSVRVKPSDYATVVIRIQNNTEYTDAAIYFNDGKGGDLRINFQITAEDQEIKEYTIDLSGDVSAEATSFEYIRFDFPDGLASLPAIPNAFLLDAFTLIPNDGIPLPAPADLWGTLGGKISWSEVCPDSYELVISDTELNDPSTGTVISPTASPYVATGLTDNTQYFLYLKALKGTDASEWISSDFYYYSGETVDLIIKGQDNYYLSDPTYEPGIWGWYEDSQIKAKVYQNGYLVALVGGVDAFEGDTISVLPNFPITIEWPGGGPFHDKCDLTVLTLEGETLFFTDQLLDDVPVTLGPINISTDIATPSLVSNRVLPTIGKGDITVRASVGSEMRVLDVAGKLCRSLTIASEEQPVSLNLASGVYFVVLNDNNTRTVSKIVVAK